MIQSRCYQWLHEWLQVSIERVQMYIEWPADSSEIITNSVAIALRIDVTLKDVD